MNTKFETLVSYNRIALIIVCFSPFLIWCLIGVMDKDSPLFFAAIVIAVPCIVLFGLAHFLLSRYFDEFIRLEKDSIVYRDSRMYGGKERIILFKNLKEILWENEVFDYVPGSRNSIYLVDNTTKKTVLFKNRIAWFLSINKTALDNLSKKVGLPIKRTYYTLSGDLKQRREQK